jgi:hypothetical protein
MTLQTWLIISAIIALVISLTSIFATQSMRKPFGTQLIVQGASLWAPASLGLTVQGWLNHRTNRPASSAALPSYT